MGMQTTTTQNTSGKFAVGQMIEIDHNGHRLQIEIVEVRPKAIKGKTLNTAGEFKQFSADVWFPIAAILDRPMPKDATVRKYYQDNRMNEGRFVLAAWFALNDHQKRMFRSALPY